LWLGTIPRNLLIGRRKWKKMLKATVLFLFILGELYYESIKDRLNAQYDQKDLLANIEIINDGLLTPKAATRHNTFDNFFQRQVGSNTFTKGELRKFSLSQIRKTVLNKTRIKHGISQSFDHLKKVLNVNKLVTNIEKPKVRGLVSYF
jgi:hypothetical protein